MELLNYDECEALSVEDAEVVPRIAVIPRGGIAPIDHYYGSR